MNAEHADERAAKAIVECTLGIKLVHADKTGGVDYLSADQRFAVEVTRVTDGRRRAGRKALDSSRKTAAPTGELRTCWVTMASDTQWGLGKFIQQVHPALVALEHAGETDFNRQRAAVHVLDGGPLSPIYRTLIMAGVERASAVPDHEHRQHVHRVVPSLGSGGTASGSNEALRLLVGALAEKEDNAQKLKAAGAKQRHLFVWIDDDTQFSIARPLSREAPAWHDGFGVPTEPPAIGAAITHLWIVHEGSRMGWFWDGHTWREFKEL
ncbi:hypothetical protein [Leucobacter japonicus]|uniref:hypothetical protein n=1 Tax=Leucobacter japonicus TaxID=1461259 RepID=UPI0006A7A28D|nr:hypothetical protein [Leucobacter japonicus]